MKRQIQNPEAKKDSRNIFIIVGCVLIIAIIVVSIIMENNEEIAPDDNSTSYVFDKGVRVLKTENVKTSNIESETTVITNYQDYLYYYNDVNGNVLESMFDSINFVLLKVEYMGCTEKELVITDYKVNGNNIDVTLFYTPMCGLCAPNNEYFLLEVPKSVTTAEVNVNSYARSQVYCDSNVAYKPIIYLYPTEDTNVSVKLLNSKDISVSYPKYDNGWNVLASPSSNLYDAKTNRNYYGLYWEGKDYKSEVTNEGFIVSGENSSKFLEEKLEVLGLNEREINEFIIYWLPKLEKNNYNYIRFETNETIDKYMPLEIEPTPDTIIRVYMVYKGLEEKIDVKTQELEHKSREGFSVIEWGGSEIN